MAMQAGMGLSRIVVLVGAGAAGTIAMRNGKLSEVIAEIEDWLKKNDLKGGDGDLTEQIASQVHRLTMEVRQIASSRSITVLNGGSGQTGITAFIIPAATVGALGYAYMWWKGIKFSDLMYVTKRNMANAVSGMTKHLEGVSNALAQAKKHLTQRIERLDDKLDEQKQISTIIKDEVTDARLKIMNLGTDINGIVQMVYGLDKKLTSMEDKQNYSFAGVMYLCQFAEGKGGKMPEFLHDASKVYGRRFSQIESAQGFKGLLLDVKANTDGATRNDSDYDQKMFRSVLSTKATA